MTLRSRFAWGSRSSEIFEKLEQIGEGTYGKVYMAKNKETNEIVALKEVRMDNEKEGFPITAIREIKILKELSHDNIVQLKEIVTSEATKENQGKSSIYMVFEYMDHDLTGLMLSDLQEWKPTLPQIKCYMKQLLEGLYYCHSNNVLHRDIKGSNLLINNKGQLKLADFGLARPYTEQQANYTNRVITLWYRPPELLLGAVQYGPAIDMWSVGCILAELLAKKAIFPGKNEIDQLELIFKLCGTPTEEVWPAVVSLPWYHMFKPQKIYKRCLRETFKNFPPDALDLVDDMLTLDPSKRITAAKALDSDFFWKEPIPCAPVELPKFPSSHEFQAKKRRQNQQQSQDAIKRQKGTYGGPIPQAPPPSNKPYQTNNGQAPVHGGYNNTNGRTAPVHVVQTQEPVPSGYHPPHHRYSAQPYLAHPHHQHPQMHSNIMMHPGPPPGPPSRHMPVNDRPS